MEKANLKSTLYRFTLVIILGGLIALFGCGGGDDGGSGGDPVNDISVQFTGLEQEGGESGIAESTALILTFDVDPEALTADNITITGATKGALSGSGTTRTIGISDITVDDGDTVSVTLTSPDGYAVTGSPRYAMVYRDTTAPAKISLAGLSVNDTETTFNWTDPSDADFDYLEVTYSGTTEIVAAGTETLTISGLTEETLYKISIKSVDGSGNESDAAVFYVKTLASGSSDSEFILIEDDIDLVAVSGGLAGNYLVIADIDLSSYTWTPLGDISTPFSGIFNGNGHTVSYLTIDTTDRYQGLFGYTSGCAISGLGIIDASISAGYDTGGLVGRNDGSTISDCYSTGEVTTTGDCTGGLVGRNDGSTISDCYATGKVTSTGDYTGGLVGVNNLDSTISDCYATAEVTNTGDYTGGLVGYNVTSSTISDCYATGWVVGTSCVGGLVGTIYDSSTLSDCYATGAVSGTYKVGGLVGNNNDYSTISDCYATGAVSGTGSVGGLVGSNYYYSTISDCYATGGAVGTSYVGGFVGLNYGSSISDCYATGAAIGTDKVGGLVGYNLNSSIISCCYATGAVSGNSDGGLVGYDDGSGTVSDSFYDSVSTGYRDAGGSASGWTELGTAKTTDEMQSVDTFTLIYVDESTGSYGLDTAWDFAGDPNDDSGVFDTWDIDASINDGYPHLTWLLDSY